MSSPPPTLIVVGPRSHGVAAYADDLAREVALLDPRVRIELVERMADVTAAVTASRRSHLHVTDGLFGSSPDEAGAFVEDLAVRGQVTLTLHDLPQESDGVRNLARRSEAYRRMTSRAAGVVVSSGHERALVHEHLGDDAVPAVIPLGTRVAGAPRPTATRTKGTAARSAAPVEILIAGYVYPGKGHADAIRAAGLLAARHGVSVDVVALGEVVSRHRDEADRLSRDAAALGVGFHVTGFLGASAYREACRSAGLPLVAHQHYSASRSLLDWAEQGRRPAVVETRYTTEMAALRPGTLRIVPAGIEALAEALEAMWQDPASTVLDEGHPVGPTLADAARAHLSWWESLPW